MGYAQPGFPPRMFLKQNVLAELRIHGNSDGQLKYPDDALGHLSSLTTLQIDGLKTETGLGSPVKQLRHLKTLKFGIDENTSKTVCLFKNLTASFLKNTPFLNRFELSYCQVGTISSDAFVNVTNLQHLRI